MNKVSQEWMKTLTFMATWQFNFNIWTPIHVITNDVMTSIVHVLIFKKTYNLKYYIFYNFDYLYV
jgi:hypothetical protein